LLVIIPVSDFLGFFFAFFIIFLPKRVPISSNSLIFGLFGLNLILIGSKLNLKPPSFNFVSSKSIASPLQPKLPKIPTGLSL